MVADLWRMTGSAELEEQFGILLTSAAMTVMVSCLLVQHAMTMDMESSCACCEFVISKAVLRVNSYFVGTIGRGH